MHFHIININATMKVDDNHENQEMTTAGKENVKEGQNVEI